MNEQWRPIETAPKDGTWIWCYYPDYSQRECAWGGHVAFSDGWWDNFALRGNPTHWMPLPEPPQETNMNEDQALDDMLNGVSKPTFEDYAELVRQWAADRQILQNSTAAAQLEKLEEERQETLQAIEQFDKARRHYQEADFQLGDKNELSVRMAMDGYEKEIIDGFGDMVVCLVNAAAIADVDLTDALAWAYGQIRDRRGYLNSDGIFVKDEASHE